MRGENQTTQRKTSQSKGENQQQTQPTYGVVVNYFWRCLLEHTKRQVKVFFFPGTCLYFLLFISTVCFLFLLKLRWPKTKSIYYWQLLTIDYSRALVAVFEQGMRLNIAALLFLSYFSAEENQFLEETAPLYRIHVHWQVSDLRRCFS